MVEKITQCQVKLHNDRQCPHEGLFKGYCALHWRAYLNRKRKPKIKVNLKEAIASCTDSICK